MLIYLLKVFEEKLNNYLLTYLDYVQDYKFVILHLLQLILQVL